MWEIKVNTSIWIYTWIHYACRSMQKIIEKIMKIYRKKVCAKHIPVFTNSLALCGTIWRILACRVALYNQDTTTFSFLSLFPTKFLDFSEQVFCMLTGSAHCWLYLLLVFQNGATKHCQMATHSRGIFSESSHATQACVQAMNVLLHTWIWKSKLCCVKGDNLPCD